MHAAAFFSDSCETAEIEKSLQSLHHAYHRFFPSFLVIVMKSACLAQQSSGRAEC